MPTPPYLHPATEVDVAYCVGAPATYEDPHDCVRAVPVIVAKARAAEAAGYDAMVVSCMLDPGVREARRAVRMPVIGLGSANLAIARLLGEHPARCFTIDIPVARLEDDEPRTLAQLVTVGRQLIAAHGADVLVPNCARLGDLSVRLEGELAVPVLPNEAIGLKVAEILATFRLRRAAAPVRWTWLRAVRRAARWARWRHRWWIARLTSRA